MSLWKIAWRSIEQRALASSLTALSMALGVALVVAVLVAQGVINDSFRRGASGYHLVVGKKGSQLQLVLNTVYHLQEVIENVPYTYYKEFTEDGTRRGTFAPYVDVAIPYCLGDNYEGFRVVGTIPEMFEKLDYAAGKKYEFEPGGRNFEKEHFFDAVVGSAVARKTGLKVGDEFQPTHGLSNEGDGHKHDAFTVVGVLKPTGTANDRALFINMEGFYLLDKHAKPLDEDAVAANAGATADAHAAVDHDEHTHAEHAAPGHDEHAHDEHAHDEHDAARHEPGTHEHAAHEHEHAEHDHAAAESKAADHDAHEHPEGPLSGIAHDDSAHAEHAHDEHDPAQSTAADMPVAEHDAATGHEPATHEHAEHAEHEHDAHEHEHAEHDHPSPAGHDHAGHDHAGHDHAGHDHAGHDHHHDPLPESQREVTAILVLAKNDISANLLQSKINKGVVAQAASPIKVINDFFKSMIEYITIALVSLTVLIIIVAGVGIMVSIYNSMSDRRRDIAVMRALGAGRETVLAVILLESILLSLGGGVLGFVLGHALIAGLGPVIESTTGVSIGFFRFVPYELILIPGLIVLASFVGYLPALSAYRTDVGKALSSSP